MTAEQFSVPVFEKTLLARLLEGTEGPIRQAARAQLFSLELLDGLDGTEVTGPRLGWMALVSRLVLIATSVRRTLEADDRLGIAASTRAALEMYLDVMVLLAPMRALEHLRKQKGAKVARRADEEGEREVIGRFATFAAWSLAQDAVRLKAIRGSLREVYDGRDAARLVREPEMKAVHEALLGPILVENQHVLDQQRNEHEAQLDRALDWVESQLRRPDLATAAAHFQLGDPPHTLSETLGEGTLSTRRRLRELNLLFVYQNHAEASRLLHGGSVFQHVLRTPGGIHPTLELCDESDRAGGEGAAGWILQVVSGLLLAKRLLWPDDLR